MRRNCTSCHSGLAIAAAPSRGWLRPAVRLSPRFCAPSAIVRCVRHSLSQRLSTVPQKRRATGGPAFRAQVAVWSPRARAASGAHCHCCESHAISCKLAVPAVREGLAEPATPSTFLLAVLCSAAPSPQDHCMPRPWISQVVRLLVSPHVLLTYQILRRPVAIVQCAGEDAGSQISRFADLQSVGGV
jgi:hypothetical protein